MFKEMIALEDNKSKQYTIIITDSMKLIIVPQDSIISDTTLFDVNLYKRVSFGRRVYILGNVALPFGFDCDLTIDEVEDIIEQLIYPTSAYIDNDDVDILTDKERFRLVE